MRSGKRAEIFHGFKCLSQMVPMARIVRSLFPEFTLFAEEIRENRSASFRLNAAENDGAVVQPRVIGNLKEGIASAALGIRAAIHDHRQPSLHHGTRTHRTGFESRIKDTSLEPPRFQRCSG